MIDLLDQSVPLPLRFLLAHRIGSLSPWRIVTPEEVESVRAELRLELQNDSQTYRDLFIFARRQDCDDFAGFVVEGDKISERVVIAHVTYRGAPEADGYPLSEHFDTFWAWLNRVVDDASVWADEDELAELLSSNESPS